MDFRHPIQAHRHQRYEDAVLKDGVLAADELARQVFISNESSFAIPLTEMPRRASVHDYVRRVASFVEAGIGEIGLSGQVEFDPTASERRSLALDRLGRSKSPAGWMPILKRTPTVVFNLVQPE